MINSRNDIVSLLKEYIVTQQEYVYQFWMPEAHEWNVKKQVAYYNGIVLGKFREKDAFTLQVLKEGVTDQALYDEIKINLERHIKMIEGLEQPDIMNKMQMESYKRQRDELSRDTIDDWISNYCRWIQEDGFETTLKAIFSRSTLRLDAKYRWLWDVLEGKISLVARGAAWNDIGNYVKIVELNKIKKGDLAYDRKLIDLDSVYPLCGGVNYDEVPEVSMIGSDKVEFSGADLVVSKLEPYLGKCIINPEEEAIGTTEWVGLKCKKSSPRVVGYLLSLPQMREAMRMLQSGKRHARMDAKELLQLKINIDLAKILEQDIQKYEEEINSLKNTVMEKRKKIDDLYSI